MLKTKYHVGTGSLYHLNFPHYLSLSLAASETVHTGWCWQYSVGARLLPLKVAPIQRSVTTDFHLQLQRDNDCLTSEFYSSQYWLWKLHSNVKLVPLLMEYINVIILEIKGALISYSLSKPASKVAKNNGLAILISSHSAHLLAVPWREWGMSKQMVPTTANSSYWG